MSWGGRWLGLGAAEPGDGPVVGVSAVVRAARLGVVLLVVRSLVGVGTVWLLPVPAGDRVRACAVFAVAAGLSAVAGALRWERLPRPALTVLSVLGLGSLAAVGASTTGIGPVYTGFVVFSFVTVGLTGSVGAVLAQLPGAVVAWLMLNGVPRVPVTAALGVRLAVAVSVWASVGLLLARHSTTAARDRSELVDTARTDPLTGLSNRRVLEAALAAAPVGDTVVVVDIDGFRDVNTARGHSGGDTVLAEFGRTVRVGLRAGDVAVRQGGDEFVLLLTAVSDVQVLSVLGRLRDQWRARCGQVTFSAGAATRLSGETGQDTLRRADRCCYQAKDSGRDRWVFDDHTELPADSAAELPADSWTGPTVDGSSDPYPGALLGTGQVASPAERDTAHVRAAAGSPG